MTPDFKAARERFEANWQWDTSDPKEHVLVFDPDLAADWAWKHKDTIRTVLALAEKVMEPSEKMLKVGKKAIPAAHGQAWIYAPECFKAMIEQACLEINGG